MKAIDVLERRMTKKGARCQNGVSGGFGQQDLKRYADLHGGFCTKRSEHNPKGK